jgi:probable addiction module antidote protein
MPAYLFGGYMSEKSVGPHLSQRQAAADCINQALEKSDIAEICHAIGAATHLHNMSDIAKKSGIERPSLYRAFSCGPTGPNFKTVLSVLDAMGFRLKVTMRRGGRARPARLVGSSELSET